MTKPSRVASNGRLAPFGSSLLRERACILSKAAREIDPTAFSEPPAIIAMASPLRIVSQASPIVLPLEAQAETADQIGHFAPVIIETTPAVATLILMTL